MIRKLATLFVLVPLTVVIVMFAVANRQVVTVTFDPFDTVSPAFALTLPLFLLVFVLVGLGVLIGGTAAWLRQHKWRARAREAEIENRRLRQRAGEIGAAPALPARPSPVRLPPAA